MQRGQKAYPIPINPSLNPCGTTVHGALQIAVRFIRVAGVWRMASGRLRSISQAADQDPRDQVCHAAQVNYADPAAAELEELGSESDAGGSGAASDASLPPAPSDSSSSGDSHGRRRRRPAPDAPGLLPAPGAPAHPAGVTPMWAAGGAAPKPELAARAAAGAQAGAPRPAARPAPVLAPTPRPMVTGGRGGEPLRVCGLDEAQRRHFLQASLGFCPETPLNP